MLLYNFINYPFPWLHFLIFNRKKLQIAAFNLFLVRIKWDNTWTALITVRVSLTDRTPHLSTERSTKRVGRISYKSLCSTVFSESGGLMRFAAGQGTRAVKLLELDASCSSQANLAMWGIAQSLSSQHGYFQEPFILFATNWPLGVREDMQKSTDLLLSRQYPNQSYSQLPNVSSWSRLFPSGVNHQPFLTFEVISWRFLHIF